MYDKYEWTIENKDFDRQANICIMNDELIEVSTGPSDKDMSHGHHRAIQKGRNHGLCMFVASQRNQDIPKMHCNVSMDVLLFKLKKYDINALGRSIEYIEYCELLPQFHFIHTSTHRGITFYKPIPLMLWK